jgi:uncharacterized protein (DUF885 family)
MSLGLALVGLAACGAAPAPSPPPSVKPVAPREELARIVERYWDEKSLAEDRLGLTISRQFLADSLAMERRYLAELLTVPRASLNGESKLTYDIFKRGRELAIEGFTYPAELLPVNAFSGMPQQFARLGSGMGQQPFASAEDYENWLQRIDDFVVWTNLAIANMREGMRRGYTLPRVVIERTLPMLAGLAADTSANPFYRPLRSMPGSIVDPQRSRIGSRLGAAIKDKILPSYRTLHDFLQGEYLPRARDSVAWSALPLGEAWYAYLVRKETSTALTPAEIHRMGLAEVERIHGRLQSLLAEIPFPGNAQSYFDLLRGDPRFAYKSPDELLVALNDLKIKVAAASPTLFGAAPRSDVEIRAVAGAGASWPLLSYRPAAPDRKRPAVLDVDTDGFAATSVGAVESLFLQEAVPGRHYQLALQQERADLPMFRRFGGLPAFVEGWGLYAASLGDELGLHRDPEEKFESLLGELRCALGLVIDTGLHSKGWTRQQALDYLHAQMPIDDAAAAVAVDRDIALPGAALAGEIGDLKIQALRARAQQTEGARFDIRAFHAELLKDGAMPLDILEAKIRLWIDTPP